jgi:AcrR family transcriptional regulator
VLAAARDCFAERGFDGCTIRAIAGAAGVDPALVHHYFGSKEDLFVAAVSEARGALVASQLAGLILTRYVLHLEPLASASAESLVAALAPTLQRYLTGEVTLPRP